MRTKAGGLTLALTAGLVVAACSSEPDGPPSSAPATSAEPATAEPKPSTPDPTTEADGSPFTVLFFTDPGAIPARADQTPEEAAELETLYLTSARGMGEVATGTDEELVVFGTAVCDAMDENGGEDAFLISVAAAGSIYAPIEDVPDEQLYVLGTIAVRTICPEYHAAAE